MHFKFRHLHKIVGGFFLLAVAILFLLLVLVARGQRWFQGYVHYTTMFEKGGGLQPGDAVTIKGIEVGKVETVELDSSNRIFVKFAVFDHYANRIRQGTEALLSSPFIGAGSIVLELGETDGSELADGSAVPPRASGGGELDALLTSISNIAKRLEDPQGDLMQTLGHVRGITKELEVALSSDTDSLHMRLRSAMGHLDRVLAGLDDSTPDIQDAIGEARKSLEEANTVLVALEKSIFLRGNVERFLEEDAVLVGEGR